MSNANIKLKPLYIIGAGGFGREVAWLIERLNKNTPTYKIMGFIDDNLSIINNVIDGYTVVGGCDILSNLDEEAWCIIAVGNPQVRKSVAERIQSKKNIRFATLIDPCVQLSNKVTIGEGSIICAGSILTVDINIGKHCIINLDSTIGHDAFLGDYVTLYPSVNVSGCVSIKNGTEIGTGANIIQGIDIGENCTVGAGSVVIRNIENNVTEVGVPTKTIARKKTEKSNRGGYCVTSKKMSHNLLDGQDKLRSYRRSA